MEVHVNALRRWIDLFFFSFFQRLSNNFILKKHTSMIGFHAIAALFQLAVHWHHRNKGRSKLTSAIEAFLTRTVVPFPRRQCSGVRTIKDRIPTHHPSNLICLFKCRCDKRCVEKIMQRLETRVRIGHHIPAWLTKPKSSTNDDEQHKKNGGVLTLS